ncbi:MAG: hypothetical protein RSB20_04270 [Clostridia bacterium]
MAKMKNEINFIESQKLVVKQNQSTSFEFVLIVSVVVLVAVMAMLYVMGIFNNKNAQSEIDALNAQLDEIKAENERQANIFNKFEVKLDKNGNPVFTVDELGNKVKEYNSIEQVAMVVANQLKSAIATKDEVKSQIDLTSTVLKIVFSEAVALNCEIKSMSYTSKTMTIDATCSTMYEWGAYKDALIKSTNTVSGFNNSKYISGVVSTAVTPVTGGGYSFKITFNVIDDTLYFDTTAAADVGGAE